MTVGVLRTPEELQAVVLDFAAQTGLPPERLVGSRFGYPTVPRQHLGSHDGRRRVPPEVRTELAWMPVFWLDAAAKTQGLDEPDDAYCIRIYLELVDRGVLNPDTMRYVNPLRRWLRMDITEPEDRRRLRNYQDGGWDAELCSFVIPPVTLPPIVLRRQAQILYDDLSARWDAQVNATRRLGREQALVALARLREVDSGTLGAGAIRAAEDYEPRRRRVLSQEIDALAHRLDLLVADVRAVAEQAEVPVPLPPLTDPSGLLQAELAAVFVQGRGEATESLVRAVRWLVDELVIAARQVAAAWEAAQLRCDPDYGYEYQGGRLRTMWDLWPTLAVWPRHEPPARHR